MLHNRGVGDQIHYLDDFLYLGPPGGTTCAQALCQALDTCQEFCVPVAAEKVEGPATFLTFLGIQIDTHALELSLPQAKLERVAAAVARWSQSKVVSKWDLQSLIGLLSHAVTVVPPGRMFIRHLIDTVRAGKRPHHQLRLNAECRSDVMWWATFLHHCNGRSLMPQPSPSMTITCDASGSWGCGAWSSDDRWLQVQWPTDWEGGHIAAKEMVPVVITVAIWGRHWCGHTVLSRSDNMAVVAALKTGSAKDQPGLLMHLLWCLHFFAAKVQIAMAVDHIPGEINIAANAISRNYTEITSHTPQCQGPLAKVPSALLDMLLLSRPDWTSPSW